MAIRKVWEADNADYRAEAIERLRALFPQGSEVNTVVTHVARSGMSRSIEVLGIRNGRVVSASPDVARVLGWRLDDSGRVHVGGCGMDMCFHLTYTLARTLYQSDNSTDAGYLLTSRTL